MLQKRDQARGDTHHLAGAHVDVLDLVGRCGHELALVAGGQASTLADDLSTLDIHVGGGDVGVAFLVGTQPAHLVGELAILHHAVGRDEETVIVHTGVDRQVGNEADVGAFGGLDRANAAIVRDMHVPHIEAGALSVQAARPEGREAPLVGELRQRVGLVNHLAQFAAAKEVLDGGGNALGIDQRPRGEILLLAVLHTLLNGAAQLQEALAQLLGGKLVNGADATIAQVIDIVDDPFAGAQLQQVTDRIDQVDGLEGHAIIGNILLLLEFAVDAEATHLAKAVAVGIKEFLLEQVAGLLKRCRIARTHALVDLQQRFLVGAGGVFGEGGEDERILLGRADHLDLFHIGGLQHVQARLVDGLAALQVNLARFGVDHVVGKLLAQQVGVVLLVLGELFHRVEGGEDVGVAGVPRVHGAQQRHGRKFAGLVDADAERILLGDVQLNPGTALGNDAARMQLLVTLGGDHEVHAR